MPDKNKGQSLGQAKDQQTIQQRGKEQDPPESRSQGSRESGLAQRQGAQSNPFAFMRRFSEQMDRLFEDFGFGPGLSQSLSSGGDLMSSREFGQRLWNPAVEVFTRGDQLVVRADLPGLTKDDVKVECTDDAITIRGERKHEFEGEREGRFHSERSYGRFFRTIPLPEGATAEDAKATFRDGVLEVTLKAPKMSQARQIQIES